MTLSTRITASVAAVQTGAPDTGQARADLSAALNAVLSNGTGNTQADIIFQDKRSLATGANEDLDLRGVLLDVFGATVNIVENVAMLFLADAANTTILTLSPADTNGFVGPFGAATHSIALPAGAAFLHYSPTGYAVTAGTGDLFNVANAAGATANYTVCFVGRSA